METGIFCIKGHRHYVFVFTICSKNIPPLDAAYFVGFKEHYRLKVLLAIRIYARIHSNVL